MNYRQITYLTLACYLALAYYAAFAISIITETFTTYCTVSDIHLDLDHNYMSRAYNKRFTYVLSKRVGERESLDNVAEELVKRNGPCSRFFSVFGETSSRRDHSLGQRLSAKRMRYDDSFDARPISDRTRCVRFVKKRALLRRRRRSLD